MSLKQEGAKDEISNETIQALTTEKDSLDESFVNARRLLSEAIESQKGGKKNGHIDDKIISVIPPAPEKVAARIRIPEKEHPKYNFVGKLLGPKGSTLKQLQLDTGTRMAILGRNSMRDKQKEEAQRSSGDPQYAHLNKDLHILVEAFCPAPEAYSRLGHALTELKKYLVPDPREDMGQGQMSEMGIGGPSPRGGGRGGGMSRGRGGPPGRGMPRPLGAPRGRGAPASRGVRGGPRGRGAPPGRGRAAPRPLAYQQEESYYDDGYGAESYAEGTYEETYTEGAADDGSYGYNRDGSSGDGYQSYDYGGYGGASQTGAYGGAQSTTTAGSYGGYGGAGATGGGTSWSSGGAGGGRGGSMKSQSQYSQKPASRQPPYARY